jgi:hypothetical protein
MGILRKQIGWSQESNLLWEILRQLNKLAGAIFNLKPKYKVYTALLTQSGGDDPFGENGGTAVGNYPELMIGRTYYIADNFQLESDFTNVGAPNNNVGTYFVATGTTPASWGTYALLQYNLGAPVVTVLENTIGNIWFTYEGVGIYNVNSDSMFTENKTYLPLSNIDISLKASVETFLLSGWNSENVLTLNNTDGGFVSTDDMGRGYLEIRVYN